MKSYFANALKLTFVAAGLFLLAGCAGMITGRATAIRLKVVDAKYAQPIAGASIVWREDVDDLLAGHLQTGPTNLAASDNSGVITINVVHHKMTGRLILSCPGYTTIYGVYSDGSLDTSDNIQPPPMPQDLFILDDAQTDGRVNGCFLVKMHR